MKEKSLAAVPDEHFTSLRPSFVFIISEPVYITNVGLLLSSKNLKSLMGQANTRAISPKNNMKLIHWPLMGELLHSVQRRGDWVGPQPA